MVRCEYPRPGVPGVLAESAAQPSSCAALPLLDSAGTSVECTTAAPRDARIAATGAKAATGGNKGDNNAAKGDATGDPQKSFTLSKSNIQGNYAQDGSKG